MAPTVHRDGIMARSADAHSHFVFIDQEIIAGLAKEFVFFGQTTDMDIRDVLSA